MNCHEVTRHVTFIAGYLLTANITKWVCNNSAILEMSPTLRIYDDCEMLRYNQSRNLLVIIDSVLYTKRQK